MKEVSITEFGAVGNGFVDDYVAIQAALDSGASVVTIPMGVYNISSTLLVHSNTTIVADRSAKLVMKGTERKKRGDFLLRNSDVINGNVNIHINGGIWDGNNTAAENRKPDLHDPNGYSGTILSFINVDGLHLKDMVLANSVTFNVRMSRVHNFTIENIDFISDSFGANQDGLHFGGDVKHGSVRNIRALSFGQTNDDFIALNADDCLERVENYDLVRDAIEDITFENLYAESCHTIIRMLSVYSPIRNIRIRNVFAGYRCYAINADAARYCNTPLFDEVEYPNGCGCIEDIDINDFTCVATYDLPENWKGTLFDPSVALAFESNMRNFRINGFKFIYKEGSTKKPVAIMARNLVDHTLIVDNKEYNVADKNSILTIEDCSSIAVNCK